MLNNKIPQDKFDFSILLDIQAGHTNPASLSLYNWQGKKAEAAHRVTLNPNTRNIQIFKRLIIG